MQRIAPPLTRFLYWPCAWLGCLVIVTSAVASDERSHVDVLVPEQLANHVTPISIDSGLVRHRGGGRSVIWETAVHVPNAHWLRLTFDQLDLGAAPPGGEPTLLRLISAVDGAIQTMNAAHARQWRNTSAYFNGNLVIVQIIADPGAEASRAKMTDVIVGDPVWEAATICGPDDDRVPSADPRAARALNSSVCTAWLIDGENSGGRPGCFLSAGHCVTAAVNAGSVIQFNVPLSNANGSINHPGPEDQYVVDGASLQFHSGGVGNDWAYFGCFPNSTTGLTALQAQGDAHSLAATTPVVSGQQITITGFGSDSGSSNFTEQTNTGPYFAMSTTSTWVRYQTDTTGGNSGSPVLVASGVGAGTAIGIHSHGGCQNPEPGTANSGTSMGNGGLQAALANPQGICWPCHGIDTNSDMVINIVDLLVLLDSWGPCGESCLGDGNADGEVGISDLLLQLAHWGPCPPGG